MTPSRAVLVTGCSSGIGAATAVTNAGYSQSGAVESFPDERVRAQFETDVFGPLALCRLVLPGMREQGWGKVVNVSSVDVVPPPVIRHVPHAHG